ncbi:MAG: RNA polymerase sigma factor [Lachnospira eligens]
MIRKNNAGKRQAKVVELTKELEECIGDGGLQTHLDKEDIGEMLSHFLETVDKNKRIIFLRRYWYSDSIKDISERMQMSESAVKVTLHRTRKELRRYLESEGLYLWKKSEAMDLYEGLNEISPQMIEEAEITRKLPVWISGIKRAIM